MNRPVSLRMLSDINELKERVAALEASAASSTADPSPALSPQAGDNSPEGVIPPTPSGPPTHRAAAATAYHGEGPVADSAIPPAPATGQPNLAEVIAEVLADHQPNQSVRDRWDKPVDCSCQPPFYPGHDFNDMADWRAHVAPLIAARIQAPKRSVAG